MSEAIRWWLVLQLVGIVLLPLCLALFRRLPDRGYTLSKPFGLIFLGYTFWLLNSLHVLPNTAGGIVAALVVLGAVSAIFVYRERDSLLDWARDSWTYVIGVEIVLLIVFAMAVWLRSMVGQINGTEQPMDLMFINAATQASHFPPKDPWLSGHTVAYYYFGYLIVAMTGRLSGVAPEIAYNIGLGTIATMALVGAAGIVYNLVHMRETAIAGGTSDTSAMPARARDEKPQNEKFVKPRRSRQAAPAGESGTMILPPTPRIFSSFNWRPAVFGLAGGLMLVVMGNLVWVFQFLSAYGVGGRGFYDWVDVSGLGPQCGSTLTDKCTIRHAWYPANYFGFFDASRIYPLDNKDFRAITEFPMFSFLLGDLHPHVMALPFVLLVIAAALTLYRSREPLDITFWLQRPLALIAGAVLLGGVAFINTWDIVALSTLVVAMAFLSNFGRVRALTLDLFIQSASFAAPLIVLSVVFYLPFLLSISGNSQVDGLNAVVSNNAITVPGTRPFHLFLFWGPLFAIVLPLVGARLMAGRERITRRAIAWSFVPAALIVVAWVLVFALQNAELPILSKPFPASQLGPNPGNLIAQIQDRGIAWVTAIVLAVLLAASLLALWIERTSDDDGEREPVMFALGLTSLALLLVLGCEFFFVGDVFKSRMNTVFKLYYEAWTLLAIAGGFSLYYLASTWRVTFPRVRQYRIAWAAAAILVLAGAALYPLGGTYNRTRPYDAKDNLIETGGELAGIRYMNADDLKGIDWLNQRAQGQDLVIAEAVGDDYSSAGRISMTTGIPAILGWGGHEDQWRGGTTKARAGRFEDVNLLYSTPDASVMSQILKKYGVTYVYVGPQERSKYGNAGMDKFNALPVAFQSGAVTIYRATTATGEVAGS